MLSWLSLRADEVLVLRQKCKLAVFEADRVRGSDQPVDVTGPQLGEKVWRG